MPDELERLIRAAEAYAERGWSVMPVRADKRPCVRSWKARQTARVASDKVRADFEARESVAGVAVILGAVCGHLWARDFDDADSYAMGAGTPGSCFDSADSQDSARLSRLRMLAGRSEHEARGRRNAL